MHTIDTISHLRDYLWQAKLEHKVIAFVPTMGNLHEGHLQLIDRALEEADLVVASIFVNPLQFGPREDFNGYPRTFMADQEKLMSRGCHVLFTPTVDEMYPDTKISSTIVKVPHLDHLLCGATRPGHFTGVATVVSKLFGIVQPDVAIFGLKDFQQFLVIQQMTSDLCLPVRIIGAAIARAENGLALSSRNGYLSTSELQQAAQLQASLVAARLALESGNADMQTIEEEAQQALEGAGFRRDYFTICRQQDLQPATKEDKQLAIVAAAYLGGARLIDNIRFTLP
ncbi:MAG: pantoate--beta-alanine ligase [Oceanospirillaceae bacterium]|jgi:pantoate--beta-alanine ligase|nr:pantoate--beta-alanine ligase [Oceanospirillaceae bacterium]MBT4443004.1 pantoate--beta-alanine ligase [Oceanospirillaceae bacterium]MBT6077950.1 pantoate--beta-alanine ligase [Oceanospirillaceae bacterium]MBT7331118.1 pantoate--beta-alanine ligase [Oceanospirillaceae bacterium]